MIAFVAYLEVNILDLLDTDGISRRKFLGMGLVAAASALVPSGVYAAAKELAPEKAISFYNVYTHENLETVYWKNGLYVPEALSQVNHLFRDIRSGKVKTINKELIDLLYDLQQELKTDEPFQIISGYRSPHSNAMLRKTKKGVAKNSLHMYGKAADIRLPGYSLKGIRGAAMKLRAGGVGYYPRSKFVHVDVGSIRYWRG